MLNTKRRGIGEPAPHHLPSDAVTARRACHARRCSRLSVLLALAIAASASVQLCRAKDSIRQLYDLLDLPVLRDATCHQRASYDPAGGADDGHSGEHSGIRSEGSGTVIFDEAGPGCIYRVWTSSPDGRIKIYFDGEEKPAVDMPWRDMFTGERPPFSAPFVASLLGGYVSYVPMPFAEHCKIVIHGQPVHFYQITYHTTSSAEPVSTFIAQVDPWDQYDWEDAAEVWRGGGLDMPAEARETLEAEAAISPGETLQLASIHGAGVVRAVTLGLVCDSELIGREAVLRMYWDGNESASVEVPVGDFFLSGFGQRMATALPLGRFGDTYYCRLPMPFETGARIEIENESATPIRRIWWRIEWDAAEDERPPMGRFHAGWRRDAFAGGGDDFTVLETQGRGHFIGCSLSMQGLAAGGLGFLEGDERIYVDGAADASDYHGTGTDHYFNGGGYFGGAASTALYGCTLLDETGSRCAAYRFHITDTVPFTSRIRVAFELGDRSRYRADYSSVAYWYQAQPGPAGPSLPSVAARLPGSRNVLRPSGAIPAEELLPSVEHSGPRPRVRDYAEMGVPAAGRCVVAECDSIGASITLRTHVPLAGRYRLAALLARGPDFGATSAAVDGVRIGEPFDAFAPVPAPPVMTHFGAVPLAAGPHDIRLRAEGRNELAQGLNIGIDSFVLRDIPDFVDEYMVLGPFPMRGPEEMDERLGPEKAAEGQVRWDRWQVNEKGYLDLAVRLRPSTNVVAYAQCHIRSPVERDAVLLLGSDDRVKVWLNGLLVHRSMAVRGASPDKDRIPVHLKGGWNALLIKVGQTTGGWGLYVRMDDPNGSYVYAAEPPSETPWTPPVP